MPYGLTLTANSPGGTDSRNHDNTSMFPVDVYCVLSVNASVARAASVVYCLKIEPKLCNKFCVVQRLSGFTSTKLHNKRNAMSLTVSIQAQQ